MRLKNASLIVVPNLSKVLLQIALIIVVVSATWLIQRFTVSRTNTSPIQSPAPTIVYNAVGALRAQRKLVVLQVQVAADITKQSDRRLLGISLGETRVLLRAPGQVQFVIPLDRLAVDSVKYDAAMKVLVLHVPTPVIDRDIVGVDPSQITVWRSVGWCRLPSSAHQLEGEAKTEIISELIAAAVTVQTKFLGAGAP
jgi:hypothetical protein